ncbi:MAG TPA: 50S ribosomal protein L25 [Bacteroidetes bacterium]|nr:50S ribosomal protein L25 [Bacteroidota bacterium]
MEIYKLKTNKRDAFGTRHAKAYRREDLIPCNLYGGKENKAFTVKPLDVRELIYTHEFKIVELDIDGKSVKAIMKEIQFHPVTDKITHIDFQELVEGKKVKVSVPVKFVGDSIGVKEGGTLMPLMRKVIIKTTHDKLVNHIEADITPLALGQSIRVKDLTIPEGIEVMHEANIPVGYIEVPRSLKSAQDAAAKEETGATAEVAAE